MDQTGDMNVLFEKIPYFKDLQTKRGTAHDEKWSSAYGENQKTESGEVYYGTVLEHILLENLCAFYDVGEHNEMKLHGADWNDAMDMAWENGESVAFTCAYAGNMKNIAEYLRKLQEKEMFDRIEVAEEMEILFTGDRELYESPEKKQQLLRQYTEKCAHDISGNTIVIRLDQLSRNLDEKADWMMENIRRREWVKDGENGWFNGYYDDHKRPVERAENSQVRMMLTSQVFAIMSKTAQKDQIESICKSADKYLFDRQAGGYRLNTNFHEEKFDLGRMFMEKRKTERYFPIWLLCMAMHCIKTAMQKKDIKFWKRFWTLPWILRTAGCILEFRNILIIREEDCMHILPVLQAGIC